MDWQEVQSDSLARVKHDPEAKRLTVQFHGRGGDPGPVAEYDNVDAKQHAALMAATSKGQFFHRHIRTKPEHHTWRYL